MNAYPPVFRAWSALAYAAAAANDEGAARVWLERALQVDPNDKLARALQQRLSAGPAGGNER